MFKELFNLSGRAALVTGGSKGIGKAVARGLAECGANVAISARHEDELKKAKAEIADGLSVKVEYFVSDMLDRDAVKKLGKDVLAKFGRCDVLFNNAGSNKPQPLADTTEDAWDNIVELNLTSCMLLSREIVAVDDQKQVGTDHLHVVDHGPGVESGSRLLFGDEGGTHRHGAGTGAGTGAAQHHGQLPRPRPRGDRLADEHSLNRAEEGLRRANRREALGPAGRYGRPRAAAWRPTRERS